MSNRIKTLTLETVFEQVTAMLETLSSVREFKIGLPIRENRDNMSKCIREGDTAGAIKFGKELLGAARNILRAFLRNSVIDKPEKMAYFTAEIRSCDINRCHHDDIL